MKNKRNFRPSLVTNYLLRTNVACHKLAIIPNDIEHTKESLLTNL